MRKNWFPAAKAVVLGVLFSFAFPFLAAPAKNNAVIVGRVLDAETGQEIPCTVTIQTSDQRIVFDNPSFTDGFRSVGHFEKAVPSGKTVITVSRGFDYQASQQQVDLQPGQRVPLVLRLRAQAGLRRLGWLCGDNHVHMIHGPEKPAFALDFQYLALAARAAGLDYMSIAQNWNLPPSETTPVRLSELCKSASTPDFILAWNMEEPKNYWRGDVTHCLGHCWFLGMRGYTPNGQDAIQSLFQMSALDYQSKKTPTPNFESQALIRALGGVVAYTHPCRWWWGKWGGKDIYPVEVGKFVSNLAQELPYDTVVGPTYDAMDILTQSWDHDASLEVQRLWFLLLNKGYRMPATASTDSNFGGQGSADPGLARVYTRVQGPPSIEAIAAAMKAGKNFVTTGPLLLMKIGEHSVGDVVSLNQPADFPVQLEAWPSGVSGEHLTKVELIRNGEIVKRFAVDNGKKEFTGKFNIHETGTAWYIARCFGSNDLQVAITNPVYFEGKDFKAPQPAQAHVIGVITDEAGKPLSGECEVIRMVGLDPARLSVHPFVCGHFVLDVPGTARLRVKVDGYAPMMKSVFMDYGPLLQMSLNMREAELADWRTFEEIQNLLGDVHLEFRLHR
jgi:hypothetical protein